MSATCRACSPPATRSGLQRHPGDPGAPVRHAATRGRLRRAGGSHAAPPPGARPLERLHAAGQAAAAPATGWRSAPTQDLTARIEAKGDGGEVALAFDLARTPPSTSPVAERGDDAPAALHRGQTGAGRQGPPWTTRPSTPPTTARSRRPLRASTSRRSCWATLTARGVGAVHRDPARGRGHLPAGEDRGGGGPPHARRVRRGRRRCGRRAQRRAGRAGGRIVCVGTTSLRLLESCLTPRRPLRPFAAETDIFIRPGSRGAGRGRPAQQLSTCPARRC